MVQVVNLTFETAKIICEAVIKDEQAFDMIYTGSIGNARLSHHCKHCGATLAVFPGNSKYDIQHGVDCAYIRAKRTLMEMGTW